MKIFGIGLNKTGTTTLRECLQILGYEVKGFDRQLTYEALRGNFSPLFDTSEKYDAFQDFPWPLAYKEIDARFPDSKFILTTRSNSETWFQSLKQHAYRTGPRRHRKMIYGKSMPHWHKNDHVAAYERHNSEVHRHFKDRTKDYLEICWENGDGWVQLCEFLGTNAPSRYLPHANAGSANTVSFGQQTRTNARICLAFIRND